MGLFQPGRQPGRAVNCGWSSARCFRARRPICRGRRRPDGNGTWGQAAVELQRRCWIWASELDDRTADASPPKWQVA